MTRIMNIKPTMYNNKLELSSARHKVVLDIMDTAERVGKGISIIEIDKRIKGSTTNRKDSRNLPLRGIDQIPKRVAADRRG